MKVSDKFLDIVDPTKMINKLYLKKLTVKMGNKDINEWNENFIKKEKSDKNFSKTI